MYSYEISKELEKTIFKLTKKNPKSALAIEKKIFEIIQEPHHYKTLKQPLQNKRRVHIDKSFVLIFEIDEKNLKIIFKKFAHHDNIYKRKPI